MWSLKSRSYAQVPQHAFSQRGAVRCVLWVERPKETNEVLFLGTGLGYVVIWTLMVSEVFPLSKEYG